MKVLEPFYERADPEYISLRDQCKEILQMEENLSEIVQLVGKVYANKNEITRMNHSHHVYSLVWMKLTRSLWMLPLLSRMTFCNKTVTAITIVTVPSTRLLGCFVTWLASISMPLMWWKQATTKSLGPRFVIPWATSCTSFLPWSLKYVSFMMKKDWMTKIWLYRTLLMVKPFSLKSILLSTRRLKLDSVTWSFKLNVDHSPHLLLFPFLLLTGPFIRVAMCV